MAVVNANFGTIRNLTTNNGYVTTLNAVNASCVSQNVSGTLTANAVRTQSLTVGTQIVNPLLLSQLSGIPDRTTTLEASTTLANSRIQNILSTQSTLTNTTATLRSQMTSLTSRVEGLETTGLPTSVEQRLANVEEELAALENLVAGTSLDLTIGTRLTALETFQSNLSGWLSLFQGATQLVSNGEIQQVPL